MKSCKNCGCVNDNVNRYCRNCGAPFGNNETSVQSVQTTVSDDAAPDAPAIGALVIDAPVTDDPVIELPVIGDAVNDGADNDPGDGMLLTEEPSLPKKDFFDLTPVGGEESDALFGILPPVEEEPTPGYIDFDLGEEESEPEEPEPTSPRDRLREATLSPVFTIFAALASAGFILSAVQFVLGLRAGADSADVMFSELVSALFILGFERIGAYGIAAYAAPLAVLVRVCAFLPAALYAVGIWTYFGGIVRKKHKAATVGLSFITAGTAVTLILCSAMLLLCGIFGMGVLISAFSAHSELLPELLGALLLIGVIGVCVIVAIIYNCLALSTIGRLKLTVRKDVADHRLSVFVMAVNLIVCTVISAQSGFHLAGGDILSAVLSVVNMLTFAALTLYMAKCRVNLKEN